MSATAPSAQLPVEGVFVYAGLAPASGFLGGAVTLDASGRIDTDAGLRTSVPGIFAAGDIRAGAACLLAAAAGEGAAGGGLRLRYLREGAA